MCDFSQYGGASEELTQLLATLPPVPELSIQDFKKSVNQGREDASSEEMKRLGPQVHQKDLSIPSRDGSYQIPARSYRPSSIPEDQKLPIFVYYHGGGFLFGTLDSENAACSRIALATNTVVVNVCYRHTPEYVYPTAWYDSEDAFEWVFARPQEFGGDASQIVIGGVSAGGQLAAALAQTKCREQAPSFRSIKGQVLMIPCLAHPDGYGPLLAQMKSPEISSYKENENAPILPLSRFKMFISILFPDGPPSQDDRRYNVSVAPLSEVKNLPSTTFGIAGLDPLRDEGLLYAKLLTESGVATSTHVFKGSPHGFRRFGDKLSASKHWDQVLYHGIKWALSNPTSSGKFEVEVLQ